MKEKEKFLKILKSNGLPKKILEIASSLDRSEFFDEIFADRIYSGDPVPVGNGQKSDEAATLARMIKVLNPKKEWRMLEVGTGSGYSTALLASAVEELITVDYYEDIAVKAKERVILNGFTNAKFFAGDFTEDFEEAGLFDAIIVFAGCRKRPIQLLNVLKPGGALVLPMGPPNQQQIVRYNMPEESDTSDSLNRSSFHDFCLYDSIRGVYGWVDI